MINEYCALSSIGIFKYIRTHYGLQTLKVTRSYERLRTKHDKIQLDILFLTTCLKEDIILKYFIFPYRF